MKFKVEYVKYEAPTFGIWNINGLEVKLNKVFLKQKNNLKKSLVILSENLKEQSSIVGAVELLNIQSTLVLIKNFFIVDLLNYIENYFIKKNNSGTIYDFFNKELGLNKNEKAIKVVLSSENLVELRDIISEWVTKRIDSLNIERHLLGRKSTVHISNAIGFPNFIRLLNQQYREYLLEYIEDYYQKSLTSRILPKYSDICYLLVGINNMQDKKDSPKEYSEFATFLKCECNKRYEMYGYKLVEGNLKELDLKKDLWKVYSISEYQGFQWREIEFSNIEGNKFKQELKWYYRENAIDCIIENRNIKSIGKYLYRCIDIINYLYLELGIDGFAEVDDFTAQLVKKFLMFDVYEEKTNTPLKAGTISKIITELRKIVNYLIDEKVSTINHTIPVANVFNNVKVFNIHNMSDTIDVIPDVVMDRIEETIEELKISYQRMFYIFQGAGMRAKEVMFLQEDCLNYEHVNDPDINKRGIILNYIPYKVLLSQRKVKHSDRHEIYISESLAKVIEEQIKDTSFLRKKFNVPYIFISNTCEYAKIYGRSFTYAINSLIKRHNICDTDGTLWRFDSRQMRATVASNMIENGASENEIMSLLNHNDVNTTRKHYEKVKKLKLAQLNEEFFKKEFEVKVGKEQLEAFNEEERRILFVEFATTTREVEFGKCVKHDSEGSCKRGGDFACANCNKICTGKQYLPKWESLFNNQNDIVEKLKDEYQNNGINEDEYINYVEYIREMNQLNYYKSVIDSIRG